MPIIFENRLGNSKSDQRTRKIYQAHNTLWHLYYTLFFAVIGAFIAFEGRGNFLFSSLIIILTIMLIALFWLKPWRRRKHYKAHPKLKASLKPNRKKRRYLTLVDTDK